MFGAANLDAEAVLPATRKVASAPADFEERSRRLEGSALASPEGEGSEELSPPSSPPDAHRSSSPAPASESAPEAETEESQTGDGAESETVRPSSLVLRYFPFDRTPHFLPLQPQPQPSSLPPPTTTPSSFNRYVIGGDSAPKPANNVTGSRLAASTGSRPALNAHPVPSSAATTCPYSPVSGSTGIRLLAGKYLLLEQSEALTWVASGSGAASSQQQQHPPPPSSVNYKCIEVGTQKQYTCKSVPTDPRCQPLLSAHYRVEGHPHINPIRDVIATPTRTYLLFPPASTDLHSYVRLRRRLKEPHARHLFAQIVSAVHEAHSKGIVLRDLKLRKFVFTSESRSDLKLESLEDAVVLTDRSDDSLTDKHGCPAYVSPEILRCNTVYSGRAADMWGLGVMLYTMLVGRYPFHGQEHQGLFAKIRRGQFSLPDSISSRARCLIRCLLRKNPEERLTTEDVLIHPWIVQAKERGGSSRRGGGGHHHREHDDQRVPTMVAPAKRAAGDDAVEADWPKSKKARTTA
jgi:tribbles-like protein